MGAKLLVFVGLLHLLCGRGYAAFDYGQALTKSLLFFEAQRSGKLPADQRVQWRGDSALKDGSDSGVDLSGGYYDAGDSVKFGFPFAFTVTLLSWSALEFRDQLEAKNEFGHAIAAIKWGTDYLIKAHAAPDVLYAEVGDGFSDHNCWQRPEDMTTPRNAYKVNASLPGSDIAGESSAALAAAAIVFRQSDPAYADVLLTHAKQLFDLARNHPGVYQSIIPAVRAFYSSSGYDDELLWAAAWLQRATEDATYLDVLRSTGNTGGTRSLFSWDDKFVGAQTLVSKLFLENIVGPDGIWAVYKDGADQFICNAIQKGSSNVKMSPGGGLWWQPWNNLQYTTSALLAIAAYSDYLAAAEETLHCDGGEVTPVYLINFVQSQVDYILGLNPENLSYMVGFGSSYPVHVHHRGASIVSIKKDPTPVACKEGYEKWFNKNAPNPNVIDGAIVGGPDADDKYNDSRANYQQSEAPIVNTAPLVGVLARIA